MLRALDGSGPHDPSPADGDDDDLESEAPPAKRSKHDGSSKGGNRAQEPPKPPISKADLRKHVQEGKAKAATLAKEAIKQERAAQRMQAVEEKRLKKEADLLCTGCIAKVTPVLTQIGHGA